ncbi:MAG: hypothetical protein IH940_09590, partial [Acidobacteria bacterium]|nr:hypothetical protein [Acidobacteriota bacterium]
MSEDKTRPLSVDERRMLETERDFLLSSIDDLDAVGFKTVHIRGEAGTLELTEDVLQRMADYNDLAPAHNPPNLA